MSSKLDILVVSRKQEALDSLEQILREGGTEPRRKLVINGHIDPLYGVDPLPDLLVLHISHLWREELEAIISRRPERRPALIVVGASSDAEIMRLAMRAGAIDLLTNPLVTADLLDAVKRVVHERPGAVTHSTGQISAFMNAKGGSGATLLAVNVAHILATQSKQRVALFDLDMQFGTAPLYLDMYPKRGIAQALDNLRSLDELALQGYFSKHASGLDVISHGLEDKIMTHEIGAAEINQLLDIAARSHDHLVIDLPRRIDSMTVAAMQRANRVVLVVQQSVTALRDAARLLSWIRMELGLSKEQLCIVVNRYEKNAPISVDDIRKTLSCDETILIPNDFQSVSECTNSGTPLLNYARNAAITKALMALETRLGGQSAKASGSGLARVFSGLLGGRAT